MTKAKILQPDLILGDTILHLTPQLLTHHQLRGLILDVDETLVSATESAVSPLLNTWVASIRLLVPICLVSNNTN